MKNLKLFYKEVSLIVMINYKQYDLNLNQWVPKLQTGLQ